MEPINNNNWFALLLSKVVLRDDDDDDQRTRVRWTTAGVVSVVVGRRATGRRGSGPRLHPVALSDGRDRTDGGRTAVDRTAQKRFLSYVCVQAHFGRRIRAVHVRDQTVRAQML